MALPPLGLAAGLIYHVYFDRSQVPDLDAFVRFELPMIGEVRDTQGSVLIELAREYRRVVAYDDVPVILRQAILATEDRNFFSHRGIEYRSLPRVVQKAVQYTLAAWWKGGPGSQVRFPQGGSTLTQQLVRGYFLRDETSRENGKDLLHRGLGLWFLSRVLGVSAGNQLCRKVEEIRLAFWLEEQMQKRYGSREQAKREIFARYASFIYLGNGRYGFAAASEYYFNKPLRSYTAQDAGKAALLVGISKSPRDYAPVRTPWSARSPVSRAAWRAGLTPTCPNRLRFSAWANRPLAPSRQRPRSGLAGTHCRNGEPMLPPEAIPRRPVPTWRTPP